MAIPHEVQSIILRGQEWVRITKPDGWRNTVTNETAGEPWMMERMAEEDSEE